MASFNPQSLITSPKIITKRLPVVILVRIYVVSNLEVFSSDFVGTHTHSLFLQKSFAVSISCNVKVYINWVNNEKLYHIFQRRKKERKNVVFALENTISYGLNDISAHIHTMNAHQLTAPHVPILFLKNNNNKSKIALKSISYSLCIGLN